MSSGDPPKTPECPFCGADMRYSSFPLHLQKCEAAPRGSSVVE